MPREHRSRVLLRALFVGGLLAVGGGVVGYSMHTAVGRTRTVVVTARRTPTRVMTVTVRRAPAATSTDTPHVWIDPVALATRVAAVGRTTGAEVGVAVRDIATGRLVTAGAYQVADAWSTIKVPIVMATYRMVQQERRSSVAVDSLASPAITESSNEAAASLFEMLTQQYGGVAGASRYVQDELAVSGDRVTQINTGDPGHGFSTYGQTKWSLTRGTQFYRGLARHCIPPTDETLHVLGLMSDIEADQRWGIGVATWPDATLIRFKGGWGPDLSDRQRYIVRQFGVIEDASRRGFVVGLLVKPADGTFSSGVRDIDTLADVVARTLVFARTSPASTCG